MSERRYSDEEMARIFELASRLSPPGEAGEAGDGETGASTAPARRTGLTLPELQEIAREVGMSPEAVARGAAALELRGSEGRVTRRAAGIPISVARSASLPRSLTDDEWARVVMDLRETFDARGQLRTEGPFREWSNGNLHVALEPGPDGERLQMRTRRSGGEVPVYFGGFLLILSAIALFIGLVTGVPLAEVIREAGILGFLGAGGLTVGGVGQMLWSKERLAQMEGVAERTALLAASPPTPGTGLNPGHPDTEDGDEA